MNSSQHKKSVETQHAPKAIGPYSQAITSGGFLFCSGQIPLDPATGKLVEGGIEAQTGQVLKNMRAVIESAGATMDDVVKTTIFLKSLADFAVVNQVYQSAFAAPFPARSTIEVSKLPLDAGVEIEAVVKLAR